ncbi:MAG: phosphoribosyltransferase [Haloarculaceae archaeon]
MFSDRTDAGRQLAAAVAERGVGADLVLAIPRGGLPVARPVADALGVPLDVVVSKKLGAPGNPELAIGAAGSDGSVWRNDDLIDRLGVDEDYVSREAETAAETAREKAATYRGDRGPPDLDGKRVLVVDDGMATGATVIAAVRLVRAAGAAHVTVAVPVGAPETVDRVETEADAVVVLSEPAAFGAVGEHYGSFEQVSDEEARALLQ